MREVTIKYGKVSYKLILKQNKIEVQKKVLNRYLTLSRYLFSKERNCSICGSSNTAPKTICNNCSIIESTVSRKYDKIVTIGNYYPWGRMEAYARTSDISRAVMDSKDDPLYSTLFGASLALYLVNNQPSLMKYDYLMPVILLCNNIISPIPVGAKFVRSNEVFDIRTYF